MRDQTRQPSVHVLDLASEEPSTSGLVVEKLPYFRHMPGTSETRTSCKDQERSKQGVLVYGVSVTTSAVGGVQACSPTPAVCAGDVPPLPLGNINNHRPPTTCHRKLSPSSCSSSCPPTLCLWHYSISFLQSRPGINAGHRCRITGQYVEGSMITALYRTASQPVTFAPPPVDTVVSLFLPTLSRSLAYQVLGYAGKEAGRQAWNVM